MKDATRGYISISIQAFIIGFSFLFVKVALRSSDTISLLAHRFSIAAIFVYIYRLINFRKIKIDNNDWIEIAPFAIFVPTTFFMFQALSLRLISSLEAGIIQASVPVITLIISSFVLKEKIKTYKKIFMTISVFGVILINVLRGAGINGFNYLGLIFIMISSLAFGVYNVTVKTLSKKHSTFSIVYVMSILDCLVFNIISIILHILNGNICEYFSPFNNLSFIIAVAYLGIMSTLGSNALSAYALGKLRATEVGLFINLSTVVNILAGTFILKESLYYYHYIGIVLILGGILGFNIKSLLNR